VGLHSRPLGKIALVSDPALLIGANSVVDIRTPGHVGKDLEQILQLIRRQGTVSILTQTFRVRKNGDLFIQVILSVNQSFLYTFFYIK